ncbi:MAG: 4-hydroxythreonine-4-phosphate dehydrogenase PdxA, partial [Bacteroidota bacterium]
RASGRTAGLAIERSVELCLAHKADAMVTAPVSKEALNLAGYNFPGQTEMIALLSRSQQVAMMLLSNELRVGLVTTHVPIAGVPPQITRERITEKIAIFDNALRTRFRIRAPKLAVLALNPHAGEHGVIGTEDDDIITPAIADARSAGAQVDGPFPADAFFGRQAFRSYDAVVAMYHDQGLIPLKMTSFKKGGVNFSAGLSVIRTSPDHGTAYDIAGTGKADIRSMIAAITLSIRFARNKA